MKASIWSTHRTMSEHSTSELRPAPLIALKILLKIIKYEYTSEKGNKLEYTQ